LATTPLLPGWTRLFIILLVYPAMCQQRIPCAADPVRGSSGV
jgi:hypothetical protein